MDLAEMNRTYKDKLTNYTTLTVIVLFIYGFIDLEFRRTFYRYSHDVIFTGYGYDSFIWFAIIAILAAVAMIRTSGMIGRVVALGLAGGMAFMYHLHFHLFWFNLFCLVWVLSVLADWVYQLKKKRDMYDSGQGGDPLGLEPFLNKKK